MSSSDPLEVETAEDLQSRGPDRACQMSSSIGFCAASQSTLWLLPMRACWPRSWRRYNALVDQVNWVGRRRQSRPTGGY
jgi:hypothetical protein